MYSSSLMITSLVKTSFEYESAEWLKYLTTWNYMLCVSYFITAFVLNAKNYSKKKRKKVRSKQLNLKLSSKNTTNAEQPSPSSADDQQPGSSSAPDVYNITSKRRQTPRLESLTCSDKLYWMLFSIVHPISLIIIIIYWGFLNNGFPGNTLTVYIDIDQHAIAYGLLLFEYAFTDIPIRILHFIYPFCFALLYLMFNMVYCTITGDIIYPMLDWKEDRKKAGVFVAVSVVVTSFLHVMIFLLDVCKRKLARRLQ